MLWRDNETEDGTCILFSWHIFSISGWKKCFVTVLHQAALGALGPEALAGQNSYVLWELRFLWHHVNEPRDHSLQVRRPEGAGLLLLPDIYGQTGGSGGS